MKLVIVESPTKSKTIGHYLGSDYVVEASVGHIRDLAISGKGGFGVDVEHDFKPTYVIDDDKKDIVKKLQDLKKKSDEVILATDPDREGEAIAWHLATVLKLPIESTKRLEFHEITRESIKNAIEAPRVIDLNLVHSQETRRIIDRIIGFKLSALLKSKIRSQSAGRVQSVTLKMIVEHEKEINEFKSEEYWTLESSILHENKKYKLNLTKINNEEPKMPNKEKADEVLSYTKENVVVSSISESQRSISSKEPYRTSTLQQDAFTRYGFKTKETTFLAQQLYEGIEIDGNLVGLITYIRTDSTKLSDIFIAQAKDFIISKYGEKYYKGQKGVKDVRGAQDAHEAIRPTNLELTPAKVKPFVKDHVYKLYKMIYERTLASLMTNKVLQTTTITFKNSHLEFELKGNRVIFDGYNIIKFDDNETSLLPKFNEGTSYELLDVKTEQNFTKPPARYTEAKIVKLMEEKGIGRPSTYSATIQTLLARKYVTSEKGFLVPTEQGILTSNVLNKYFKDLMNTEYTAEMETSLDKISIGEASELEVIKDFYYPFIEHFDEVKEVMYKEPLKPTGEKCPLCGGDLVYKTGKHGEFIGCSNYPSCKYVKKEEKEQPKETGRLCPNCGSPLLIRKNKRGQEFIGCSNYPSCRYVESMNQPEEPSEEKFCPECGAKMVVKYSRRGRFWGCSNYPNCNHMEPYRKKNVSKN
mgnify:FL=1